MTTKVSSGSRRRIAGWIGFACCALAVLTDALTVHLRGLSALSTTVSRVSTGDHSWISDSGIISFGIACLIMAAALRSACANTFATRAGAIALSAMGLNAVLIAVWNDFDRKSADDFGVHMVLLYVFSGLFPLVAGLWANALGGLSRKATFLSWLSASLWIGAGAAYFVVPDALKGLFERITLLLPIGWLAGVSWLLVRS